MLVHEKTQKIVLNLQNPERVTTVIPSAKIMPYKGSELVVVPHDLTNTKTLRAMGMQAPSPIEYYYNWSGQYKPFRAQHVTSSFLTLNDYAFVLNDMGTGKTLATLWAFDYLRSQGLAKSMLIVSPLSTLERTWADEVFQHFPHLTVGVLHGVKKKRQQLLANEFDIYLINHDGVKTIEDDLIAKVDIDTVVIDEIATFRNAQTGRWKSLSKVCKNRKRVWGLTGTPTPNSPTDAWGQCRIICPDRVPKFFGGFRDHVMRKVSQFKYEPRENAVDIVADAMQPAVRFRRDECVDLPDAIYQTREVPMSAQQIEAYKEMRTKLVLEMADQSAVAVNEAVKLSKLLQVCCIAEGTPVLTDRGWVNIECVTSSDKVWDGDNWVRCNGAAFMGFKSVVQLDGVGMTPDHRVLTVSGWVESQECIHGNASGRFNRASVRLPDSCLSTGHTSKQGDVVMPLRVRARGRTSFAESTVTTQTERKALRLSSRRAQHYTRYDSLSHVPNVAGNASALPVTRGQRLPEVRRTRHTGLRQMEQLQCVSDGHGSAARGYDARQGRQREMVHAGQLSLGYATPTGAQYTQEPCAGYAGRPYDTQRRSAVLRHPESNAIRANNPVRMDCAGSADNASAKVYDVLDCGPQSRFVVRGAQGQLLIVHNCGSVYDTTGSAIALDVTPRTTEVIETIEQAAGKVLVFVPFTAALEQIAAKLREHWTVGVIHGGTTKSDRDRIFHEFQKGKDMRVLVANPATLSHGLTLTSANTIVWFGPPTSAEQYEQANARITRPGQKLTQFIVHIEATEVERKVYKRLREKRAMQGLLLDVLKGA